jgi:cyclohexanone monooxygenase
VVSEARSSSSGTVAVDPKHEPFRRPRPDGAVDVEGLRERYRLERDRRLRLAAESHDRPFEAEVVDPAEDPYAGDPRPREPIVASPDVLVIGGGFGGLQAAVSLRAAGIEDFMMIDVAADFGGTWYWNRYPGVCCDIESYIYLPLLEETGYMPSERYVSGPEIFEYCRQLARQFDLYEKATFQTKVTGMEWDPAEARWHVSTSRGDELRPRFVFTQSGIFTMPKLPVIEGIETFAGAAFHTARWDYEYSGGSVTEPLVGLRGKRVAVIGTGVTALQLVPRVAETAAQLTVFQRTPTAVAVRDNAPTDPEWFRSQPPGWHEERMHAFNRLTVGEAVECPIDDGWTRFFAHINTAAAEAIASGGGVEEIMGAVETADYEWNEMVRARVDASVADADKAENLKAWYRTMCKRPGFSDEYLAVFDREEVDLVDTSLTPIEAVTPGGLLVDGEELEFDCLVFATGFELGTTWARQAGYDVVAGDERVSAAWDEGIETLHGLYSHEFPNVFFLGLTQTGHTLNAPHILGVQGRQATHVVRHCLDVGHTTVRASAAAQAEWQTIIRDKSAERWEFQEACTPGYINAEGKPTDSRSAIAAGIYTPATEFLTLLDEWREAGDFAGLEFDR